jgi:hypothetical protein
VQTKSRKIVFRGGGVLDTPDTTDTFNDGKLHNFVGTHNGSVGAGAINLYVDNTRQGTRTTTQATAAQNTDPFSVGSRLGSFGFGGRLSYVVVWNRELSVGEALEITRNPYQILKPKQAPVYFTADAGGGTITVPATLGTIAYASQNTTVSITGSIDVTATLGTISYASNNTTVDVSGSVDAIATLGTINYASNDAVVGVTGSVDVVATLGTINYTPNSPVVSIGGVVVVQATLGTISYASNDTVISLQGVVSVPATLGTISYTSNDTVVSLAGLIDVNATLGTISYTSNNTTVTVAAGQTFGVVGVGFADDLYSSTFKPDLITVNFRG